MAISCLCESVGSTRSSEDGDDGEGVDLADEGGDETDPVRNAGCQCQSRRLAHCHARREGSTGSHDRQRRLRRSGRWRRTWRSGMMAKRTVQNPDRRDRARHSRFQQYEVTDLQGRDQGAIA